VPVFFEGANSRLFQLASHRHLTLRLGMLLRELRSRIGTSVKVEIGEPVPAAALATLKTDPKAMMDFLRKATYVLSPRPVASNLLGHEFEAKYRGRDSKDGGRDIR